MIGLILLGGAGTRLWPLSTDSRPKQFLRLFGKSLFQLTLARLRAAGCSDIVIITTAALRGAMEDDLHDAAAGPVHIVLEPARRDSAPAIAAGVAYVREQFGADAIIGVMPSDHLIRTDAQFAAALQVAAAVAAKGRLVTFGVRPTFPATIYGYIERGAALADDLRASDVRRFHEKPEAGKAEAYVRSGAFDWNSGMFVFSVRTFAGEAAMHMPDIWTSAQSAVSAGRRVDGALLLDPNSFNNARKTSIDYALFERSASVAVVPATFDWSDVGDWASVYSALDKDPNDNVIIGNVRLEDCKGTLAVAHNARLALSGLSDMIVVATNDGTFAAPRERAADVKRLIL